jgi:glycosyltransferase involved in cell wall biosynthesis
MASLVRYVEKQSCEMADKVVLDTEQHINYFLKEYAGLHRERFIRCWLGADDAMALENKAEDRGTARGNDRPFVVHFHGEFQALHGVNYIVEAAALLPEITFRMIGAGMELKGCKDRAAELGVRNIAFYGMVEFSAIPRLIGEADICLGIFGETEKTRLVIPFKVFESLVMGRPVITADTPAIRELFQHRETVYLCKPADPVSLADAIRTLRQDDALRKRIAVNGNALFKATCSPERIGQTMHGIFQRELGSGANC